jgi:signal transduction histidine kinase
MHPTLSLHTLIPMASALCAAVLAIAVFGRDPSSRANRLVSWLLVAAAFWSTCEASWNVPSDPQLALQIARCSTIGPLMVGALAFRLSLVLEPRLAHFERWIPFAYAACAASIAASVATPMVVSDMLATDFGWVPQLGSGVPIVYMASMSFPAAAAWSWIRLEGRTTGSWQTGIPNQPWGQLAVGLPLVTASMTDFLLPFFEIYVPRLGVGSLVAWGGITWWSATRLRNQPLSPHEFAREILATLPDGVVVLRDGGVVREANETFGELAGCPARELVGRPIAELLSAPPESEGTEFECDLIRADGERTPVSFSNALLHDERSSPIGSVLVVRDLREMESLRNRLVTSGRLAAVGQLAAGIAHEINNPISFVRSNMGLLLQHWEEIHSELQKTRRADPLKSVFKEGEELIHETFEGVDRVASIVRDVGGLRSSSDTSPMDSADPNALLDSAVRVTAPQLRGRVEVVRDYADAPLVRCRGQELMQVFLNLLLNASHALPDGGTIRLSTEARGGRVIVSVSDNGSGIEPENADRIFEPFFTTKPVGVGTGLGLSISKQIIDRHDGKILVSSEAGVGTRFEIILPSLSTEGAAT